MSSSAPTEERTADPTSVPPGGLDITRLDLGGDVVFVTDRDGTIVDVNDAFVRVTGYPRDEAIGSTPKLLSSGLQDDRFYAELWSTITAGHVWEGEMVDRRRDGTLRTHHVTITPIKGGDGQVTHFVAVERDISSDLARQSAGGPTGLAHTDAEGRCLYVDSQTAQLLESSSSELLGDGLLEALVEEDAEELREIIAMAADRGRELRADVRTRGDRWLSADVAPLTVASGNVIGTRIALEDVTQRLAASRELAKRDAFLSSVLDAVHDPIAVVDANGLVLTTNLAWRRGAEDRPEDDPLAAEVGDDLLGLARDGDDDHLPLAHALNQVLTGLRPRARVESGAHITPLVWDEGGAVVRLVGGDPEATS